MLYLQNVLSASIGGSLSGGLFLNLDLLSSYSESTLYFLYDNARQKLLLKTSSPPPISIKVWFSTNLDNHVALSSILYCPQYFPKKTLYSPESQKQYF